MATSGEGPTFFDQFEVLFDLAHNGVITRIDERGRRCGELYQWGLHPPRRPAPGSPLEADDAAFARTYALTLAGERVVTEHALFPAGSAVESLHTAGILIARRRSHRQPHIEGVMQLSRVAMESAALTIWLLGDSDRSVRRDRCMSEEMEQLRQQRHFLKIQEERDRGRYSQQLVEMNARHRRRFNDMFEQARSAYTFANLPTFTDMVSSSAKWVDAHVPAHDTGEIAANRLEGAARSFYSYGSSFVHGYKWITDYARNGTAFSLLADALAVSLNMAECAVCLFEAASRAPGGTRPAESYVPERFEPTIAAWSAELFGA